MTSYRRAIALGVVIAVLASSGTVLVLASYLPPGEQGQNHVLYSPIIHPLSGGNLSAMLQKSSYHEASSQTGYDFGLANSSAVPVTPAIDSGHILVTVSELKLSNGTAIIFIGVENIGKVNAAVNSIVVSASNTSGSIVLESYALGCVNNSNSSTPVVILPNNTTTAQIQTFRAVCSHVLGQPGPITLAPGSSFNGYILIDAKQLANVIVVNGSASYWLVMVQAGAYAAEYSISSSLGLS